MTITDSESDPFPSIFIYMRQPWGHKAIGENPVADDIEPQCTLLSDENVPLYNSRGAEIERKVRLIKARKTSGEELWFLSTVWDLPPHEITRAYKHRWTIEVLFKFLQQHLPFKPFISYDPNAMEISLYGLLIIAILFSFYKKCHNLTGYKMAMLRFMMELNKSIIKDMVLFCGGDPSLVDQRL